jgi:hypothetical protein
MRKNRLKYSIKKDLNIHAIVVEATGMINTVVAKEMVMNTGIALNESGLKRCFFDLSNTEVDPKQTMMAMLLFSQVFERADICTSVRMAALYASGEDPRLYLEEGTSLLGMKLKHFKDRDEALDWLVLN